MPDSDDKKRIKDYNESLLDALSFSTNKFVEYTEDMLKGANQMTEAFGGSRARVSEMMSAVSEAAPKMRRLGADFNQTLSSMQEIAKATGKNTLASADSVSKLYASTKVIGVDTQTIASTFTDVGIQFGIVGKELEKSVVSVRDLGLDAKQVMGSVVNYASQLNKFNFENGVQGLTKMAARASMLRSDMSETFRFADEVMDPENAIAMASTFQRLGVSVGNLADPFALMNASINDPGALQDSIAKAAQAYTTFDEKTKTFKINPQGMLTLRQMAKETGMSYDNLSKMGLASAELDKRLSQISPTLNFKDESDKQFLSNLSEMDASGNYVVKINDSQTKNLADVTQEEFDRLIEEQKNAPKTMEDIAKASMKSGEILVNEVGAIKEAVVRGAVSTSFVKDNIESLRRVITVPATAGANTFAKTELFNTQFEKASNTIRDAAKQMADKNNKKSVGEILSEVGTKFKLQGGDISKIMEGLIPEFKKQIQDKNYKKGSSEIGEFANQFIAVTKEKLGGDKAEVTLSKNKTNTTNVSQAQLVANSLSGSESVSRVASPNQPLTSVVDKNITYNHTGTVTFKVDVPAGVDAKYLEQWLQSKEFQQAVYKGWQSVNKEKTT